MGFWFSIGVIVGGIIGSVVVFGVGIVVGVFFGFFVGFFVDGKSVSFQSVVGYDVVNVINVMLVRE